MLSHSFRPQNTHRTTPHAATIAVPPHQPALKRRKIQAALPQPRPTNDREASIINALNVAHHPPNRPRRGCERHGRPSATRSDQPAQQQPDRRTGRSAERKQRRSPLALGVDVGETSPSRAEKAKKLLNRCFEPRSPLATWRLCTLGPMGDSPAPPQLCGSNMREFDSEGAWANSTLKKFATCRDF